MKRFVNVVLPLLALFLAHSSFAAQKFRLYDLPAPDYPKQCLDRGIQGTVLLQLHLSDGGKLRSVSVVSSPRGCPQFAQAALNAVKRAKFYGTPRRVRVTEQVLMLPVTFSLNDG